MKKYIITEDKVDLIAATLDEFGWCSGHSDCDDIACARCIKECLLLPLVKELKQ